MYTIKTKNERYTGILSGISFLNGVGKVENLSDYDIKWFKRFGHEVIKEKIEETEEVEETEKNKKQGKKNNKTDKVDD